MRWAFFPITTSISSRNSEKSDWRRGNCTLLTRRHSVCQAAVNKHGSTKQEPALVGPALTTRQHQQLLSSRRHPMHIAALAPRLTQRVGSKIEDTSAERGWSRRRRLAIATAHGATAVSSSTCSGVSRRPARIAAFSAKTRTAGSTWLVSGRQGFGSRAAGAAPGRRSGTRLKNPVAVS
jgi:hypothetical protein